MLHFDIAVLCFILLQLCLGSYYSRGEYILSWVGWFSVGNSNWFIFVILAMYFMTYLVLMFKAHVMEMDNRVVFISTAVLCVSLWIFLQYMKSGMQWWIDTIATYPLGMWYAIAKEKIDKVLCHTKYWLPTFVLLFTFFIVWHYRFWVDTYGICAVVFCLLLVVFSMKIRLDNKLLQWLGTYAFAIYIMQRWPMLIYVHYGLEKKVALFVCLSIPSALLVAFLFQSLLYRVDKKLFVKSKR